MEAVKFGNFSEKGVEYGTLISKDQLHKVKGMVVRAVSAGATVLCGGKALEGSGYFYSPIVITGATQDGEINQKEIFGPVIPVKKFSTLDEAI